MSKNIRKTRKVIKADYKEKSFVSYRNYNHDKFPPLESQIRALSAILNQRYLPKIKQIVTTRQKAQENCSDFPFLNNPSLPKIFGAVLKNPKPLILTMTRSQRTRHLDRLANRIVNVGGEIGEVTHAYQIPRHKKRLLRLIHLLNALKDHWADAQPASRQKTPIYQSKALPNFNFGRSKSW